MTTLPQDIIMQILLLLPLESLLASKCVSKQWKNLINNPRFVKLYRNKSTVLYLYKENLYCLFISYDHDNNNNKKKKKKMRPRRIPIGRLNRDRARNWISHNLLLDSSSRNKRVCVKAANGDFLVYDLLTGNSYKVIPDSRLQQHSSCWCLAFGFGYDSYADDYKIVLLVSSRDEEEDDDYFDINKCNLVFVYSFRNGGWTSLKGFPDAAYYWRSSQLAAYCFNGVLHWVVEHDDDVDIHPPQVVAALDLQSARLAEIALPGNNAAYNYDPCPTLAELDGHLCCCNYVYRYVENRVRFDVYVMKEYGVEESWTMLLRIDDDRYLRLSTKWPFGNWRTAPALYPRDGGEKIAISLCHKSKLRVLEYNLRKDEIRVLHETTGVMDKIVRRFKKRFKKAMEVMLIVLFVCIGYLITS